MEFRIPRMECRIPRAAPRIQPADRKGASGKGPRRKASKSVKNIFDTSRHFALGGKRAVSSKGGFVECASFLFSFWENMRTYPRSGFRSGGTSECNLVPVSVQGKIRQNHPFGKPPFWKTTLLSTSGNSGNRSLSCSGNCGFRIASNLRPDLFRFAPLSSDLFRFVLNSEQIRETPFCRPLLQIPDSALLAAQKSERVRKSQNGVVLTLFLNHFSQPQSMTSNSGSCSENCGCRIAQVMRRHSENGISHSELFF